MIFSSWFPSLSSLCKRRCLRGEDKHVSQCWKLLEKIVSGQLRGDLFV
jgi:hypothetical protein